MASKNKNIECCKYIAEQVEAYTNGQIYNYNGEKVHESELNESELEDAERLCLFDYLERVLDIKYILNSSRKVEDAKFMIACDGPDIWLNTENKSVELYWWGEYSHYSLTKEACDALREVATDLFYC